MIFRLLRIYRYFRGQRVPRSAPWATLYTYRPRARRDAVRLAVAYARKGADAA